MDHRMTDINILGKNKEFSDYGNKKEWNQKTSKVSFQLYNKGSRLIEITRHNKEEGHMK
jgi:hypothetical protein